ncbi:MAG: hypothetical protein O3B86_03055, partial [Planctomycetota bacterium]|nr:hypothetical protein [Planctomycetota bacterium]
RCPECHLNGDTFRSLIQHRVLSGTTPATTALRQAPRVLMAISPTSPKGRFQQRDVGDAGMSYRQGNGHTTVLALPESLDYLTAKS